MILSGKRIAALILVGLFSLTLVVAYSAEPLRAETATESARVSVKAFTGNVSEVNETNKSFTLDLSGRKIVVTTSETTKFQTRSANQRTNSSFSAIVIDGRVSVIGSLQGSTLTARVVFIAPAKTIKRHADRGTVTAISSSSFSYNSVAKKNSSEIANFTSSTVFTKKVGNKMERTTSADLSVGDRVSFVGTTDDKGVITVKLVHIIPANPNKTATSSAR